jgi:hypothetical protein
MEIDDEGCRHATEKSIGIDQLACTHSIYTSIVHRLIISPVHFYWNWELIAALFHLRFQHGGGSLTRRSGVDAHMPTAKRTKTATA